VVVFDEKLNGLEVGLGFVVLVPKGVVAVVEIEPNAKLVFEPKGEGVVVVVVVFDPVKLNGLEAVVESVAFELFIPKILGAGFGFVVLVPKCVTVVEVELAPKDGVVVVAVPAKENGVGVVEANVGVEVEVELAPNDGAVAVLLPKGEGFIK